MIPTNTCGCTNTTLDMYFDSLDAIFVTFLLGQDEEILQQHRFFSRMVGAVPYY